MRKLVLALSIAIAAPSCAAVASILPVVTKVAVDALSVLAGIDTVVQEHFRRYPDIPGPIRQKYAQLYDNALQALRALQKAAEGGKALDDGDVQKAFADFQAAYEELKGWLKVQNLMDDQSRLLLDGEVISELPPASEFRAE